VRLTKVNIAARLVAPLHGPLERGQADGNRRQAAMDEGVADAPSARHLVRGTAVAISRPVTRQAPRT